MKQKIAILFWLLLISFPLLAQSNEADLVTLLHSKPALADYAQFEAAEVLFRAGNYHEAANGYQKVISQYPDSLLPARASLMVGKCYLNEKKYSAGIQTLQALIADFPEAKELPEARFLIAKALDKQGQWKAAYLAYEEIDLLHPLSYFAKQSRLAAAKLKKKYRARLPRFTPSAANLFNKGQSYFDNDDYENAVKVFSLLAREYPKSKYLGQAWLMLGRAEMQTNNSSAIADLQRAEASDNPSGRATFYLAQAYARRGQYNKAVDSMQKIISRFPGSNYAGPALYWSAYYRELMGDINGALRDYYATIIKYPYSESVPSAIWRLGRAYYWTGDYKNAVTYLHLAEVYPVSEDTPRCYYFEAKALEKIGKKNDALIVYQKLAQRFDHTYYAYRAKDRLHALGLAVAEKNHFSSEEFSEVLSNLEGENLDELAAIMEIWEQSQGDNLSEESSTEVMAHFTKYKELLNLGVAGYAADEARYLVNLTSDSEKESAQTKLGEMLVKQGEYRTPIRFADRKVKAAVLAGQPQTLPKKVWQLSYPRGYWQSVSEKATSFGLDPYLALAVIREESRFNPRATSRSGARGLMQIMPRTGLAIAKDLDLNGYRKKKLYTPNLNIQMGTYYLSNLLKNFNGNVYLSLAGYNGGPNRIKSYVKSWYNGNLGAVDIDEFVESIPSRETRLYVQKVMGSYFEYKRIYDRTRG